MPDFTDSNRYQWLLANPESGRHLLGLLMEGKGDEAAFTKMVDRIMASEQAAKTRRSA